MLMEAIFVLEVACSCTTSNGLLAAADINCAFKHVFTVFMLIPWTNAVRSSLFHVFLFFFGFHIGLLILILPANKSLLWISFPLLNVKSFISSPLMWMWDKITILIFCQANLIFRFLSLLLRIFFCNFQIIGVGLCVSLFFSRFFSLCCCFLSITHALTKGCFCFMFVWFLIWFDINCSLFWAIRRRYMLCCDDNILSWRPDWLVFTSNIFSTCRIWPIYALRMISGSLSCRKAVL